MSIFLLALIANAFVGQPSYAAADSLCAPYQMRDVEPPAAAEAQTSFFFKIEKPGVADSYLLGTFHAGGEQVLANWEFIPLLFASAKVLVTEADFNETSAREFSALSVSHEAALASLLGPEFFARARKLFAGYGIDAQGLEKLKPWRAFLQLASLPREASSLDAQLFAKARASGLAVQALQSTQEMVASIESLSSSDQLQVLKESICSYERVQEQSRALENLYGEDAVAAFVRESERMTSPVSGLTARLSSTLVSARNQIFEQRLRPYLENGGMIAALGVSHLFGREGLIVRLRESGYSVTPLERRAVSANLIADANRDTEQVVQSLVAWLRTSGFKLPEPYTPPALIFQSREELARHECDDDCDIVMSKGVLYAGLQHVKAVKARDPHALANLLAHLIRDIQGRENKKLECTLWQQKNIESVILLSRYLAHRGAPTAGLDPLPLPECTY